MNFGVIISVRQYGKNRVKVQTREMETANKILKSVDLQKLYYYNTYIPNFMLETIGYINKIPVNANLEILKNNIKASLKVTKIERIMRWNNQISQLEPTTAIKITFRSSVLPEKILIYEVIRRVTYFIPKPLLCKKCLIYGHTQKYCRGNQKCSNCTEADHLKNVCKNEAKCYYCGENHITNSYICEFKIQKKEIKYFMISKKISYREARGLIRPQRIREFNLNKENFPELTQNNESQTEVSQLRNDIREIQIKNNK